MLTKADIYGDAGANGRTAPAVQEMGDVPVTAPSNAPRISWLGIVLVLVAIRLLYEFAPEG